MKSVSVLYVWHTTQTHSQLAGEASSPSDIFVLNSSTVTKCDVGNAETAEFRRGSQCTGTKSAKKLTVQV